jgi:hypothetical protein
MRTKLAVMAGAAILCGGLPAAAHAQTQALSAAGFTTQFPGDWTHVESTRQGVTLHTLMSPGTVVPNKFRSIPKSGGIAVTVSIMSASHYKRVTHHTAPKRGLAMLRAIGIPRAAKKVKVATKGAIYKLDGVTGATGAVTYTYNGVKNLQRDVAVRKGNRLILIELNCRPDLEQAGQAGLSVVLANWHWS